ncbi:MAG: DUF433 domain-containing protein [Fimbriimonadaceae bacterium]|nr:DUF433 domain-containing protein [Fimbriimonadaceae bacterium]
MTIPVELQDVLVSSPDTLSGAVRFKGTRVPVQALLDTLLRNRSIEFFLEGYPGVTRQQVEAVLFYEQNQLRKQFGLDLAS